MHSPETLALMEAAVDAMIVIDHAGLVQAANQSTRRLFGYRSDELIGRNVCILMPGPDRESHDQYMRSHLATGRASIIGIGRLVAAQRKDGTVFPAHLSVGRIADGAAPRFVGILRDVTVEQEALAALKHERDRANAYLELNDSILLMLDPQRRICELNARGSDLLGAPSLDLHGRDWLEFLDGEDERERGRLLLDSALGTHCTREREFDALDATGQKLRVYWRCIARRSADGTPAGWMCAGEDVTARARRDEQSAATQQRLTHVARLATVGEMATGIAHELNQPLTAITTYAGVCARYLDAPRPDFVEIRSALREIDAEGQRAADMIRRMRQVARNGAFELRTGDVNALIEELRPLMSADARMHAARMRVSTTPDLPPVRVDPAQFQQVVLNLVRNAFEAVLEQPEEQREVEVTTVRHFDGGVEIRVTDNGAGVCPKIAERLFEPFCTTKATGTGLGLAMSRTIVEAHKGTIGTRRVEPHGATFYVRLPAYAGREA